MTDLAPIVLFVYNRPKNLENTLKSLGANELAKESTLYIFSDGAKENASTKDIAGIKAVRDLIKSKKWCKEVHIIESEKNLGCAPSIIGGVTEVVNKHGKVIVLEDDLVLSPFFLDYMNGALQNYEHDKQVASVGSCNYYACGDRFPSTFFVPYPDCWGWATWADRWASFEFDAEKLMTELKARNLIDKFNSYGAYNMESLLKAQMDSKVSAWDIQWTATCVLNDWLVVYPNPSVSQHVFIEDSTHAAINVLPPLMQQKPTNEKVEIKLLPKVFEAMKLGYSGKGDYYGNKIRTKIDLKFFKRLIMKPLNLFKRVVQ